VDNPDAGHDRRVKALAGFASGGSVESIVIECSKIQRFHDDYRDIHRPSPKVQKASQADVDIERPGLKKSSKVEPPSTAISRTETQAPSKSSATQDKTALWQVIVMALCLPIGLFFVVYPASHGHQDIEPVDFAIMFGGIVFMFVTVGAFFVSVYRQSRSKSSKNLG
jgi:hypothetical protein